MKVGSLPVMWTIVVVLWAPWAHRESLPTTTATTMS